MNKLLGKDAVKLSANRHTIGLPRASWTLLLLSLLPIAGCGGCAGDSAVPGPGGPGKAAANALQEELFDYAIDNLNRLQQFNTDELARLISMRLRTSQPPTGDKRDLLMETCPEPEMLRQIVDRLNRWIPSQEPPPWTLDPLVATLPEALRELPCVKNLDHMEFPRYDGFVLREAVWLRDVSDRARGEELDDVKRAKNLFDWTVRNVQLETDSPQWIPLQPWETLLFGRGTAMERARVFILLARQQRLDAVMLAPAKQDGTAPRPWAVALLSEGGLYLFDPVLGLPIPAPDGVKFGDAGQLDIEPATLAQIIADETLLSRLDAGPARSYRVKSSQVKQVIALVEGSPGYLSRRMRLVQSRLEPQQAMILTTAPTNSEVVRRLEAMPEVAEVRLWTLPFETTRRRLQLAPEQVKQRLRAMLPFYVASSEAPARPQPPDSETSNGPDDSEAYDPLPKVSQTQRIETPLHKGRVRYLKGKFTDPQGAIKCFLQARRSNQQLAEEEKTRAEFYYETAREANRRRPAKQQLSDKQIQQIVLQEARYQTMLAVQAKQDATYWLGLIAYQQANYQTAFDYFFSRTLEAFPGSRWDHGARYNLARTLEASGEHEKAIEYYVSNTASPAYHGHLLRARWLQSQQPDDRQPATGKDAPAAEVAEPAVEVPQAEAPEPKAEAPNPPHP